ncbi:MAG: hypothetical protein HPY61_01200 [Methanotrichaceae archaeon]|nr:hypothetical protein [Methanotrichaceae archaeon]
MGFRSVAIVLAVMACLAISASAQGPKNIETEPDFPEEQMSGTTILSEVQSGSIAGDGELSFRNESLFTIRADTGMSPGAVAEGVRTPVTTVAGLGLTPAAGSWQLTLQEAPSAASKLLALNLYQSGDAVFGYGQLNDAGVVSQVTVGGTVLGDKLSMYVIPVGSQMVYRFSLQLQPAAMSGSYVYSAPGVTQPGIAFGSLVSRQILQTA